MIILRKKRIILMACLLCISVFTYALTANVDKETVQTVGFPVSNKVIVLDAGHRNS